MAGDKKAFSKTIPNTEYRCVTQIKRHERGIWQRRFWEHTIIDDTDYAAHMDYIHHNPGKHGWVVAVKDLPKGHKGRIQVFIAW